MYTLVMYIQRTQFFKECTQFCIFNIYNFSNNVPNYVNSKYTNFQILYTFMYV